MGVVQTCTLVDNGPNHLESKPDVLSLLCSAVVRMDFREGEERARHVGAVGG